LTLTTMSSDQNVVVTLAHGDDPSGSAAGAVTLSASVGLTVTTSATALSVGSGIASVVQLNNLRVDAPSATVIGFAGVESALVRLSCTLNDSTTLPELTTWSGPTVPGLLQFRSTRDSVLSVDADTGVVTVHANYHLPVELEVEAIGSLGVTARASAYGNLLPVVGDVDFGSNTGPQFGVSLPVGGE
jgi:hypothetical protein